MTSYYDTIPCTKYLRHTFTQHINNTSNTQWITFERTYSQNNERVIHRDNKKRLTQQSL